MTLSTQTTKTVYIPDGVQALYAVVFPLFSAADLECWYVDAAGNELPLTDFTVEGFGSQGGVYVRFAAAPAAGGSLVIRRRTKTVQESAYPEGGKFPSTVVENDLDRIVGMIQELDEAVDRSLKVNVSEERPPESAEELYARVVETLAEAEGKAAEAAGSAGEAADSANRAEDAAALAQDQAATVADSAEMARKWAENPEDTPVTEDHYSAYHWAKKALENSSSGVNLSDALDGTRKAADGVGASEWALGQVKAAIRRPGDIYLSAHPPGELAAGEYLPNGNRYPLGSPQGQTLNKLSAAYKEAWGIRVDEDESINLPSVFADGRGAFFRAVDGLTRAIGNMQTDAIRNIEAAVSLGTSSAIGGFRAPTGAFVGSRPASKGYTTGNDATNIVNTISLDISLVVPTADENRPLNIGMTPVIYLGV